MTVGERVDALFDAIDRRDTLGSLLCAEQCKENLDDIVFLSGTVLMAAIRADMPELVEALFSLTSEDVYYELNVDHVSFIGESAISIAAKMGMEFCIEKLLEAGADINIKNSSDESPLFQACSSQNKGAMARMLVRFGADVNTSNQKNHTPLHALAPKGKDIELVDVLCKAGAKVNVYSTGGKTPLHLACLTGNTAMVKQLCNWGADLSARTHAGETCIQLAMMNSHEDTIRLLVSLGSDINYQNARGWTHLHTACVTKHAETLIPLLLELGADANIHTHAGESLYDLCLIHSKESLPLVKHYMSGGKVS